MVEKGVSQAETARILGIGKNTVGRVLKRLRDTTEVDSKDAIRLSISENSSRHHFGSIYVTVGAAPRVLPLGETSQGEHEEGVLFGMLGGDSS